MYLDMKVVISVFIVSTVLDIRIKSNNGADIKIRAVTPGVSNSRPAGLFRPATSFYVARKSI